MNEQEKRSNFVRLAESRTENALRYIRSIGKLANKNSYDYTEEDYKIIFKALESALRDSKSKFEGKKKNQSSFTLS